jgi:hypothetical protein
MTQTLSKTRPGSARTTALARLAALAVTAQVLLLPAFGHAQAVYPSPDAAASALVDAIASNDQAALRTVLGNDYPRFIPTGNIGEDDIYQFLGAWSKGHRIINDTAPLGKHASAHIEVGDSGWTLPIPMVDTGRGWRFDPRAARDEILTRRIGRNERAAMLAALGYVDAQNDYKNSQGHYAMRFVSTPGKRDGLYWDTAPGEPESPLGPLAATMPNKTLPTDAYHGYHYKILTAQGPHAQGGRQNYLSGGTLEKGYALIAWPAQYGESGVMSFIVNRDGQVYQKDLGPSTARAAGAMSAYDPDSSWQPVSP